LLLPWVIGGFLDLRSKRDRRSLFTRRSPIKRRSSSDRVSTPLRRSLPDRRGVLNRSASLAIAAPPVVPSMGLVVEHVVNNQLSIAADPWPMNEVIQPRAGTDHNLPN
jgi:hypothetical protein